MTTHAHHRQTRVAGVVEAGAFQLHWPAVFNGPWQTSSLINLQEFGPYHLLIIVPDDNVGGGKVSMHNTAIMKLGHSLPNLHQQPLHLCDALSAK